MKTTYLIKSNPSQPIILTKSGDYQIKLTGKNSSVKVISALHLSKHQKINLNLTIIHQSPYTKSDTDLKAVVEDQSMITFNSTVIIEKGSPNSSSRLSQHILLLSDQAQATNIPNLEIKNHQVQCSHAATVTNLDPYQIFYLQSRGLSLSDAQKIIIRGFLNSHLI